MRERTAAAVNLGAVELEALLADGGMRTVWAGRHAPSDGAAVEDPALRRGAATARPGRRRDEYRLTDSRRETTLTFVQEIGYRNRILDRRSDALSLSLSLSVAIVAASAQEAPGDAVCSQPAPPAAEAGGWGPVFLIGERTEVEVLPASGLEHHVDVRVYLGDGSVVTWRAGTYPATDGASPILVDLALPKEVDGRLARVTVVVEAIDSTGRALEHRAARAYAWRDDAGNVQLTDEAGALALVADALVDGDDVLVGKEVTP